MNWRSKTETKLENMGTTIALHPKKIILFLLLLSFIFISFLPQIRVDTSTEGFLHHEDPALVRYEEFKEQFGQDEMIMLVIRSKDIFDMNFLEKLKKLHSELENSIPHLNEITSILNARNTRGEGDQLIVEDLFENWPQNEQELEKIKSIALKSEMYNNLLLNQAATITTIIIEPSAYEGSQNDDDLDGFSEDETSQEDLEFLSDKSKGEMVKLADEIAHKYHNDDFDVFLAGSLAVNDYNKQAVQSDIQKFVKLVVLIMAVFLFVVFRRVSAILLPIFVVVISLLVTVGLMAMMDRPIGLPTQILPSFLLAVGIGATVHLLAMFFRDLNKNGSKENAIAYALGHSGLPIIMTSLTTAAGLLSFSTAEIAPIADLGRFAAIGIMIALVNTIILLPAMLVALPIKPGKEKHNEKSLKMDKFLIAIADFSFDNAKKIVFAGAVTLVVFAYFASLLELKHDPLSWQPDDSPIKIATEIVDKELNGNFSKLYEKNDFNGKRTIKRMQEWKVRLNIKAFWIAREMRIQKVWIDQNGQLISGEFCCVVDQQVKRALQCFGAYDDKKDLFYHSKLIWESFGEYYDIPLLWLAREFCSNKKRYDCPIFGKCTKKNVESILNFEV